jgi:hypothetical protein
MTVRRLFCFHAKKKKKNQHNIQARRSALNAETGVGNGNRVLFRKGGPTLFFVLKAKGSNQSVQYFCRNPIFFLSVETEIFFYRNISVDRRSHRWKEKRNWGLERKKMC